MRHSIFFVSVLSILGIFAGQASCGSPSPCEETDAVCGLACVDLHQDRDSCGACGNSCADFQTCADGVCTACAGPHASRMKVCQGNVCTDTGVDPKNCSKCGNACAEGEYCANGQYCDTCSSNDTMCQLASGVFICTDLQTGNIFCGACGNYCADGETCVKGACVK